ncbi:MAG: glycogen debranching N-terminal domain-containing protein [Caulobacteraceae bacterium]|nr:glycogen debranching N-terminal domain-containing protein [Caulobacteraceae bacterium]
MDDLAETSALVEEGAAVAELFSLKDGDAFLVADHQGDISGGADGLFDCDTRILSRFVFLVGDRRPAPLSYGLSKDNAVFTLHGANRRLPPVGGRAAPRGVIHIERKRVLWAERLYERVRCANFGLDEVMLPLAFEYAADFLDMFEVRGMKRTARGRLDDTAISGRQVMFGYEGLDGVRRASAVAFSEPPWRMSHRRSEFMFTLEPGQHVELYIEAGPQPLDPPTAERFDEALAGALQAVGEREWRGARLGCSDRAFTRWLQQSRADVALLTTDLPTGPYPYAGIPWFSTPFGRDGILTSWQMLWLDPSLARGVLRYLASRQAGEVSAFRDSQPGKIMHETRRGEMAAMNEIPFGLYYGGVDTTPLFVALAGAYLRRTDDAALMAELWPALNAAVGWIERYGDSNGDGLVDYQRGAETGLANQGWKDSEDSVFHADGRIAGGPIALVEVQAYAYAAFQAMAGIAGRLGEAGAADWADKAEAMRERVERRFWMEESGFYGIAIDGDGRLCTPATSNAGHLLFMGLAEPGRAVQVTRRLLSPAFDSGWGVRTLADGAARFNPISYHNGSVWPHDTSLCVAGMARYGERAGVVKLVDDVFQAAQAFDMRMPELFCGFPRQAGEPPIAYPVACMPQAWAAGSVFLLLQACLGLTVDAARREVRLVRPVLPTGVDALAIDDLEVAGARIGLRLRRSDGAVAVNPAPGSDPSIALVIEG